MRSSHRRNGAGVTHRDDASATRESGTRRGLTRLLGGAGLVLTVIASGALLPGSPVDRVPDAVLAAAPSGNTVAAVAAPAPGVLPISAPHTARPEISPNAQASASTTTSHSAPGSAAPSATSSAAITSEPSTPALPKIGPSPALKVLIPAIGVNAQVVPVDSKPTGKTNAWGGQIFHTIDFPVDNDVRQWVRRGDPNTLSADESAGNVKAFDRVLLYGHASDIGNHLVFQDLSSVKPGDDVIVTTAKGRFTYQATQIYTRAKTNLNSLAALYDYPADGAKEIALVACLPDTTSNVVVLGTLVSATAAAAAS